MFLVLWFHGGQIGTIRATFTSREEAETVYALVLAHYGSKSEVEMWDHNKLIKKQQFGQRI